MLQLHQSWPMVGLVDNLMLRVCFHNHSLLCIPSNLLFAASFPAKVTLLSVLGPGLNSILNHQLWGASLIAIPKLHTCLISSQAVPKERLIDGGNFQGNDK